MFVPLGTIKTQTQTEIKPNTSRETVQYKFFCSFEIEGFASVDIALMIPSKSKIHSPAAVLGTPC